MRSIERIKHYLPALIVLAGLLAYANSFSAAFIFDDHYVITQNPEIFRLWPLSITFRCLGELTFRLNYAIHGFNVAGYHAANLAIHIAAGLFLYGLIRRSLNLPFFQSRYEASSQWLAATCAVLWLVHPLQTESVTYICQRFESLVGLCFLFALYSFLRGATSQRKRLWYNACLLACVAGAGVKETIAAAPPVILLYDYVFLSGSLRRLLKERWKLYIALFATIVISFLLSVHAAALNIHAGEQALSDVSPWRYLATQFGVITHYLRLVVVPWPLCFDYEWQPAFGFVDVLLPGIFIGLLLCLSIWALRKRKPAGFLGIFFFLVLAPTSSIIPLFDMAFEHRMYLSSAAVIVLLVLLLYRSLPTLRSAPRAFIPVFICGILLCLTIMRNRDYGSEKTMWRDIISKRPQNVRATVGLGMALFTEGQLDEAEKYLAPVLNRFPGDPTDLSAYEKDLYVKAMINLGAVKSAKGELKAAEGLFKQALLANPKQVTALNNLGIVMARTKRGDGAVAQWKAALDIACNVDSHNCLGSYYARKGLHRDAVLHYDAALRLRPDLYNAAVDEARLLATSEDESVRNGRKALARVLEARRMLGRDTVLLLDVTGMAEAEIGEYKAAAGHAEAAIRLGETQGMNGLEQIHHRLEFYRRRQRFVDQGPAPATGGIKKENNTQTTIEPR